MKYRIVSDSSSNIFEIDEISFASLPLKIITKNKEYTDNKDLNIDGMLKDFKEYKGTTSTSSPSSTEWLEAFGDADIIFGVTLTSTLSDSFKAAMLAKKQYEEMYPQKRVYIIDSLSAGPEITLIIHKLTELMKEKKSYVEIRNTIIDYANRTHLMFLLSSLKNFSRNGRITSTYEKYANKTRVHAIGKASYEGQLEPSIFCRGQKKAIRKLVDEMKKIGYKGGKVIISHTDNLDVAAAFADLLKETFCNINIKIMNNTGLCSYFTETGGILVGFEA